jgi:hypothetical protein
MYACRAMATKTMRRIPSPNLVGNSSENNRLVLINHKKPSNQPKLLILEFHNDNDPRLAC